MAWMDFKSATMILKKTFQSTYFAYHYTDYVSISVLHINAAGISAASLHINAAGITAA